MRVEKASVCPLDCPDTCSLNVAVEDDTILLENAVFGALGGGTLAAGLFVNGAAAQDADDHIIYNSATGELLYDSDGAGGTAAIPFAQVTPGLGITHLDIYVV